MPRHDTVSGHVPANAQDRLLSLVDGSLSYGTMLDHEARRGQSAPSPEARLPSTPQVDIEESKSCLRRVCDFVCVASFRARSLLPRCQSKPKLGLEINHPALEGCVLQKERACHAFRFRILTSWVCVVLVGFLTALLAYLVDLSDVFLFDYRYGYCREGLAWNKASCCSGSDFCDDWIQWSDIVQTNGHWSEAIVQIAISSCLGIILAAASCSLTLQTRPGLDEFAGPKATYPAAGSGVAEVKLMSNGIELPSWFGVRTLVYKVVGVILSVASGLNVGKEGPFVHIATCIGGIVAQTAQFDKNNRRLLMNVSAATGLSVAFGAPVAGVIFSLEELRNESSPKQLLKTFICCIIASHSLKLLSPYGTNKSVMLDISFISEWKAFELPVFVFLGFIGGIFGATIVKASRLRLTLARSVSCIARHPMIEVMALALLTGLLSFWNPFTRDDVTSTLSKLATGCNHSSASGPPSLHEPHANSSCPIIPDIPTHIATLLVALAIKAFLTVLSFSLAVPAGIYVPSMVLGALLGKCLGHTLQLFIHAVPQLPIFATCASASTCITPGACALVGAGALACGVTRLPVTLTVALLEMTGSLDYAVPLSLAIVTAKWAADMIEPESFYDVIARANGYALLEENGEGGGVPSSETTRLLSSSRVGSVRLEDEEAAIVNSVSDCWEEQTVQQSV